MTEHIVVPRERHGIELDEFLCLLFPLLNKGFLRNHIRDGKVLLDGQKTLPSKHLRTDQVISIDLDEDHTKLPQRPVAPRVEIDVLRLGTKSITFRFRLGSGDEPGVRAQAEMVTAVIDMKTFGPRPLPDSYRSLLEGYQAAT